jgi:tetratricopeptide (TPR) repeat protein
VIANQQTETIMEKIMRFSPSAMLSSAGLTKKADDDIEPLSVALMEQGNAAVKSENIEGALDYYETALAVDPRNRAAYIAMARAVKSKGLNGKAIRFYKEALELEPNDQAALNEQAKAMLAKGAVDQAKSNLARLKMLCQRDCQSVDSLSVAIGNFNRKPVLQANAIAIDPVAETFPATNKPKAN